MNDDYPVLSHWNTVQEYSIEQAALLIASIDPYDCEDQGNMLKEIRKINHPRWKMAWGFSDGMVSAIRRGVLTPVKCMSVKLFNHTDNDWIHIDIEPSDRQHDIDKSKTIITKGSFFAWVKEHGIEPVWKKKPITVQSGWRGMSSEASGDMALPKTILNHQSEGLDLMKDAINKFWIAYDAYDKSTAPQKKDIIDYLTDQGASTNLAKAIDLVIRPADVKTIGRKKQK